MATVSDAVVIRFLGFFLLLARFFRRLGRRARVLLIHPLPFHEFGYFLVNFFLFDLVFVWHMINILLNLRLHYFIQKRQKNQNLANFNPHHKN